MRAGWGDRERRALRTHRRDFPPPPAGPPPLATGWTRFRAELRGPAARCSAPPPAAAADASAVAPPGLPPALAAPGDLETQRCWGRALRRGNRTARSTPRWMLPKNPRYCTAD
ncbi:uncharacterized protein WM277_023103 isoform 2-T3 [Molossus nigricans]